MRRVETTNLLRFLLTAIVALASFGPQATYTHSHSLSEAGHHDHGHDDADHHDKHDDDHDGPSLTGSVAHVHGTWLGFAITLSTVDGASASDSTLALPAYPTLSGDHGIGLFGPLKERVPWPESFIPPEPPRLSSLLAAASRNPHFCGTRTSYALAGRTLVLRC